MTKIIWLGFIIPDEKISNYFSTDKQPAMQTHRFGWSMLYSIKYVYKNLRVISSIPINNYPLNSRIYVSGEKFKYNEFEINTITFVNLIILKHVTRLFSSFSILLREVFVAKPKWIIIHGVHTPYLIAGLLMRLFGCKVAVVLTDLPGVIQLSDGFAVKVLKSLDFYTASFLVKKANAVISLSKYLSDRIANDVPSLIFPGVVDPNFLRLIQNCKKNFLNPREKKDFTIVYAGGLSELYGLRLLIEAFEFIPKSLNVNLKIYGTGDLLEYVVDRSLIDDRIFYGGFVDSIQLANIYLSADLLINPRPSNTEISSMSFPSKLFEYILSGVPVLTTRIKSIPDDLSDCFFFIEQETPIGISHAINKIYQLPIEFRKNFCENAYNIIIKYYSVETLGLSISNFFKKIEE
jgi:glycosyltransferase involved in cell wall biosynthesis